MPKKNLQFEKICKQMTKEITQNQVILLYPLNLYNVKYHLYLYKVEKGKKSVI